MFKKPRRLYKFCRSSEISSLLSCEAKPGEIDQDMTQ